MHIGILIKCVCGGGGGGVGSAHLLSMGGKPTLHKKIVHNILPLHSNGPVKTCLTIDSLVELLFTKFGKEGLHHFQLTIGSGHVEGTGAILLKT